MLEEAKKLQAALVIVHYDHQLYKSLLSEEAGFKRYDFTVTTNTTNAGEGQTTVRRQEVVWIREARPRGSAQGQRELSGVLA